MKTLTTLILMLAALGAAAQNPVSVRTTNGWATNLTAYGTTTADQVTANTLTVSNTIILGAATNTPTFTFVQTNFVDGQTYVNHTGRMIEVRCFMSQHANASETSWEAVMINGTVTPAGFATVASGTGGYGFTNMCTFMVSNATSFAFTNQSSGGGSATLVTSFANGYTVY